MFQKTCILPIFLFYNLLYNTVLKTLLLNTQTLKNISFFLLSPRQIAYDRLD